MILADALELFAGVGSFWGAVTIISVVALGTRYYLRKRTKQLAYQLAMEAFQRGATAEEVERLIAAFDPQATPESEAAEDLNPDEAPSQRVEKTPADKDASSTAGVYAD